MDHQPPRGPSLYRRLWHVQWPIVCCALIVAIAEWSGLFAPAPVHAVEVLHTVHMLVFAIALALVTLLRIAGGKGEGQGAARLLVQVAVLLFCAAVWTSRATHFEGKSVRFEGQGMQGLMGDYVRPSVYGRSQKMPALGFHVNRLRPETNKDGDTLRSLTADVIVASSWSKVLRNTTITGRIPLFTAWTFVRITDFGYAPRFSMSDFSGNQVDSDYQYLKLFPPGAEDSFVPFTYGYTIYLRLYPDHIERQGLPASRSAELANPLFKVRIVRHKDIVYNDFMKTGEHLKFDNAVFQLHEVVKWAEFTLVKDGGIFVALAGIFSLMTAGIISFVTWYRNNATGES